MQQYLEEVDIKYKILSTTAPKAKAAGVSRSRAFLGSLKVFSWSLHYFIAFLLFSTQIFMNLKGERLDAVVDYVFSGTRFKLYVPKHSILICLRLAGVSCNPPRSKEVGYLTNISNW